MWIGTGATIHNGAVVAANSHVVKDVPPYAIVGGDPAQVIGYRFEQTVIEQLQCIQWWYWEDEKIKENASYFSDDVELFCDRFYPEAFEQRQILFSALNNPVKNEDENRYVLIPDFGCYYAVY